MKKYAVKTSPIKEQQRVIGVIVRLSRGLKVRRLHAEIIGGSYQLLFDGEPIANATGSPMLEFEFLQRWCRTILRTALPRNN
jgi:hypothetical protein